LGGTPAFKGAIKKKKLAQPDNQRDSIRGDTPGDKDSEKVERYERRQLRKRKARFYDVTKAESKGKKKSCMEAGQKATPPIGPF